MDNTKKTYEPYVKVYVDCSYEQKIYIKKVKDLNLIIIKKCGI